MMNCKGLALSVAIAAGTVAMSGVASAQTTSYTNRAAFTTAATANGSNVQVEGFTSSAAGRFASTGGVFNRAFDGFNITGQDNGNFVGIATGVTASSGTDTPIPAAFLGQNYLTWANITGGIVSLTINFNAATTAFGFDYFDTDVTDSYNVAVAGGMNYSSPPFALASGGVASSGFFGLVSTTPFTSIVITNRLTGGYISDEGMDNFTTNGVGSSNPTPPGAVPEPATWAMMLTGFAGMGGALRRRRATRTAVSFG